MKDVITVDGVEYIRKDSMNNTVATDTQKPIIERVKSYEDACAVLGLPADFGIKPADVINSGAIDAKSIVAYSKLIIIVRALNEGWTPDWTNSNEYKYYPWFKYDKAGFGFSYADFGRWITFTHVGSRLCFKTEALAEYAGKQFIEIYNEFLN